MNRIIRSLPVLILTLLLGGCSSFSWSTAGRIVPPDSNICPLEGKWRVLKDLYTERHSEAENQRQVGDSAQFTPGVAMLDGHIWDNPNYKIKKVNSTDYIMTKYLTFSSNLVPNNQVVNVVTVSAAQNFLGEFMEINNNKAIAFVQNNVLLLQKVSDQVDTDLTAANSNVSNKNNDSKAGHLSGVLLGLKIPLNDNSFRYQTLWLAANDKKLHPILKDNDIFFPRSSGFWELQVHHAESDGLNDELSAHDVSAKVSQIESSNSRIIKANYQKGSRQRIIDYVGNDYVAIENDINGISQLQVLPVDNISARVGINVSDFLRNSSLTVYNSAKNRAVNFLKNKGISSINKYMLEENYGLTRKYGHWYLQGRINYQKEGKHLFKDYNINVIPPSKLIYYDTLYLSWQNIKDQVPEAVDAFTSPNRDIALVKTENTLYAFKISHDQIEGEPLAKVAMEKGESIIMAEWATGLYVDNWEKAFIANGAQIMSP